MIDAENVSKTVGICLGPPKVAIGIMFHNKRSGKLTTSANINIIAAAHCNAIALLPAGAGSITTGPHRIAVLVQAAKEGADVFAGNVYFAGHDDVIVRVEGYIVCNVVPVVDQVPE